MGYKAAHVYMSYEYTIVLPQKDGAFQDFQRFRSTFGEEGNLIAIGIDDPAFFDLSHFERWRQLSVRLRTIEGVETTLSVSEAYNLKKDTATRTFTVQPVFPITISSQTELDSLKEVMESLPFYRGLLYKPDSDVYIMAVTVSRESMLSNARDEMVKAIYDYCEQFAADSGLTVHYSGLPYIRVVTATRIRSEIFMFSALAVLLCAITLFLFFRSWKAVFIPLLIVLVGVVWALGYMALLGYKITLLTGVIPSLLIVIGIPNSIYMLNKYHYEFRQHQNKIKALQRVIIKIGNATLLTNLTTACGFATFLITNSDALRQFGLTASISIMTLFLLSLVLVPAIFSFIAPPQQRHIHHLENKHVNRIIEHLVNITSKYGKFVYLITAIVLAVAIYGTTLIKSSGYMVDDIPESDVIFKDLKFFEQHVDGILPLEITVDTRKDNEALSATTFRKMEQLETALSDMPEISQGVSLLNLVKFARQAFYNGKEHYYGLPGTQERNFIMAYANNSLQHAEIGGNQFRAFVDSARRTTRLSLRVKDIGTAKMDTLYNIIKVKADTVFPPDKYDVAITGTSVVSFRGTEYLVKNLISSLALAILLISAIMASMFRSWRMVTLSLLPNILPLIFTAAIMGYTGIPIKASTIIVFSIAFGISVDNTIHFLTKYRQELKATNMNIHLSVQQSLRETGVSMLYTVVVLFFGFGVYSISRFGGTVALGVLVSLTLLVAVTANLILLPSLLHSLEKMTTTKAFTESLPEESEDE
jgi:predicted RND superfamily exporter protein